VTQHRRSTSRSDRKPHNTGQFEEPASPITVADVEDLLGGRQYVHWLFTKGALTWAACGPDRSRTCDLTRASGADVIYSHVQGSTITVIYAGQTAIAARAYSHQLTPNYGCDVRELLSAISPSECP
jgi:hypothetical protein